MIRKDLSSEQRALPVEHTIDPGFLNRRKIESILGPTGMSVINDMIRLLPALPEWERKIRIGHIYSDVTLKFCAIHGIKTLEEVLATERGTMFCSTETLAPSQELSDGERASSVWIPRGDYERRIEFHYSTIHITSDTLRSELQKGGVVSIIAVLHKSTPSLLIFHPLVIGFPWLRTEVPEWRDAIVWWNHEFYEHFIEDFDEFARVREVSSPDDLEKMRHISEQAFKICLAEILGDATHKDWGGETSDHYTSHLHLCGRRVTGAFLLKGPARFAPMTLSHLGKNNDQIFRLAQEPADILFVQHCHEITSPVRATLRAFAVQPSRPRRYCLIDGRDSLRLLLAYGKYERAFSISAAG